MNSKYKYMVYTWNNLEISQTNIARRAQREDTSADELSFDNRLNAKFDTGTLSHNVVGGLDYSGAKAPASCGA